MISHQRMPAFSAVLKHEVRTWTATSLAILLLVGFTNSNPVEPPSSVDQASDSDVPSGSVPEALLSRYYGNPYTEEEATNVAKRNPILSQITQRDIDEDEEMPRYVERRSNIAGEYWNLLKALEEDLALEEMSREAPEADEAVANEVEPQNDVHMVNKRRRRYGFWATAINKMDKGHLKSFLGRHRNIYNVYKRQSPTKKWSSFGRFRGDNFQSPTKKWTNSWGRFGGDNFQSPTKKWSSWGRFRGDNQITGY